MVRVRGSSDSKKIITNKKKVSTRAKVSSCKSIPWCIYDFIQIWYYYFNLIGITVCLFFQIQVFKEV